ncbi:MAG: lysozyme inhibitor LprI family protein [Acinetobacter sp.]
MNIQQILTAVLLCSASYCANAASYDCQKAKTVTEHAVCDHRALNDADVKMATTYSIIKRLVPMGTRGVIQDEQVKWLSMRDQCRDNVNCLRDVYKMRQQKLDLYMDRVYRQGPF